MSALAVDATPPALSFAAPLLAPEKPAWSTDLSSSLYNVPGWGAPYFFVNDAGHVAVRPHGAATLPCQEIDLAKVVASAGLPLPLLLRFPDVLRHRVESLHAAFGSAVTSTGYAGRYQGVYPVKCNQDRHVVEDMLQFGAPFGFGLEAGSKPELLLAMSCLAAAGHDALLICNGYKDLDYISLALLARANLGLNTVIVLEQAEELHTVLQACRRLNNVRPVLGMRAKLRTKHAGHFGATSGDKAKFGLNAAEILSVVSQLRALGMLDCLQLLHFHIGSQIPTTALLADGVGEAAQIYCELTRLGAAMRVIDVGGGLGVDYDGTRSAGSDMSVAYSLEEYAAAVVGALGRVCDRQGVQHPVICSESGRALVSHHSVLVFEAFSAEQFNEHLAAHLAPRTYNINLSVFTSMPDTWAIEQLFPIMPIQRLQERPAVDAVLADLTCDSNGRVDRFIGGRRSLPLHELPSGGGGGYYLGMFLGGAYQEALRGLHNLLGGPGVVRVMGNGSFAVTPGPSCADVLRAMRHDPKAMLEVLTQRMADRDGATAAAVARALSAMPYLCFNDEDGA